MLIRLVHVTDDDGDVLKPAIVTARVYGNRPALGSEILGQFYEFVAELHARNAHARAENSLQPFVFIDRHFDFRYFPFGIFPQRLTARGLQLSFYLGT